MTLKMNNLLGFNVFFDEVRVSKLPIKTLFKLTTLGKAIDEKLTFYNEQFQEIIKEYALFDENGNVIQTEDGNGIRVKEGKELECVNKVNELQMLDVERPEVKFDIEEFGDISMSLEIFSVITPFLN